MSRAAPAKPVLGLHRGWPHAWRRNLCRPMRRGGGDAGRLDLSGEDRILALLAAAFSAPVNAAVLVKLRHASALWAQGDKSLAQIYLEHLRLPKLETEEQAFRPFLADQLIASGHSPRDLCKVLGFDLSKGLRKFDSDQPRDDHGRWTSGGGSGDAASAGGSSARGSSGSDGRALRSARAGASLPARAHSNPWAAAAAPVAFSLHPLRWRLATVRSCSPRSRPRPLVVLRAAIQRPCSGVNDGGSPTPDRCWGHHQTMVKFRVGDFNQGWMPRAVVPAQHLAFETACLAQGQNAFEISDRSGAIRMPDRHVFAFSRINFVGDHAIEKIRWRQLLFVAQTTIRRQRAMRPKASSGRT